MAEIKTKRTADSVDAILEGITDDARRADCVVLLGVMQKATGEAPAVWSSGAIGFGTYHYKSASGQEGDWFPVGFASRKAAITVYLGIGLEGLEEYLSGLGTFKTGKGCIYIKRLADIDPAVLEQLVATSYARMMQTYG